MSVPEQRDGEDGNRERRSSLSCLLSVESCCSRSDLSPSVALWPPQGFLLPSLVRRFPAQRWLSCGATRLSGLAAAGADLGQTVACWVII